ncbi:MAG: TIM barrel protein [Rubripirellula sp.]
MRNPNFLLISLILISTVGAAPPDNLRDQNLVAWCIVPFDSQDRSPSERAEMVRRLGLKRVAYDWREKHVPTFEEEIQQYRKHGIEYFAFWGMHEHAFALFKKYDLHPQIWRMLAQPTGATQVEKVRQAAEQLLPMVEQAKTAGCKLGIYNHGGWSGEPENMVAVCEFLRKHHEADHVGIVYNLHHGHQHVPQFREFLQQMKPYLLCLNLNGMTKDGESRGQKILPLGEGELDVSLMKTIAESGYGGPIGIIGHTQDDVEQRLQDNLDGLHWILPQLEGKPAGPKPMLRTYKRN